MGDLYLPSGSRSEHGASCVITPESAGWKFSGLIILELEPQETRTIVVENHEIAGLPLTTGCTVEVESRSFRLAGRSSVFGEITDWCYVPVGTEVNITANRGGDVALCTALADRHLDSYDLPADDVAI